MIPGPIAVGVQLALAWAVIAFYALEGDALPEVFAIAAAGWAVQHAVPVRWRLAWFLAVAGASLVAALGVSDAGWVIATGAVLVGLCLLPGSRRRRLGAVLAAAAVLAFLRVDGSAPWTLSAWPILASLFLFRAITFLYDRHHEREAPPAGLVAAYFFLPPNACFPVFPVVDFAALRRGYDPAAGSDVHQEGVERIVRGLIQLLVYRIVYHLAYLPIEAVTDARTGVLYLLTNVFMIVRIMAIFHVSIGILHLFGFKLPPTTHLPFLSPGFSEFWRRANVYWRDFMVKVFFYPAYFRTKHLGRLVAVAIATLSAFLAAWFLHSYQWFWFRGEFPLRWQDAVYWSLFGLLVTANAVWAARAPARRRSVKRAGAGDELLRALRIAGTFAVFTVLWSVWMTPTWGDWAHLWQAIAADGLAGLGWVLAPLLAIGALGVVWPDASPVSRGYLAGRPGWSPLGRPWQRAPAAVGVLAALLALVAPGLAESISPGAEATVVAMANDRANEHDLERQTEGYYQELVEIPRFDAPGWRTTERPDTWKSWKPAGLSRDVDDARMFAFKPSVSLPFKGTILSTNSFGMRDREYSLAKPPGVLRIAVLGASTTAGSGVADGQPFEALVEQRLEEERARSGLPPVEILNFATPGYRFTRSLAQLEKLALRFDPDWVVVAAERHFWTLVSGELATAVRDGGVIEPAELREVVDPCAAQLPEGARGLDVKNAMLRCLRPETPRLVEVLARRLVALSEEHGFRVIWLELPAVGRPGSRRGGAHRDVLFASGFTHLDASKAYAGHPISTLQVRPWDKHPNPFAHGLIADRFYELLVPELERAVDVAAAPAASAD